MITSRVPRPWRADDAGVTVPVCRPRLPEAAFLARYLREIDAARWYTNCGPLCARFERRLAEHAGASDGDAVAVAANATLALTVTLLALELPRDAPCLMPAWTFAATGHAVVRAGLVPRFADADPDGGVLTPEIAERCIAEGGAPPAAVIAVSPFGLPVDARGWEAFRRRTGIPVVIDAAGGFDGVRASAVPTVVSLHATKVLGIGEGAFVACADAALVRAVRQRINFGFDGSREAQVSAANAKLSEYAAAVGLAALDGWPAARAEYVRVAREYAAALDGVPRVRLQRGYGDAWVSATAVVEIGAGRLTAVEEALDQAGIGSRRWWGDGLARSRAFAPFARGALPVTDALAAATLGLPCWPDLPASTIRTVARTVAAACGGAARTA
jgi:dTDP-4-amino-4,6-dideoxygalactose transaminase